MQFPQVRPAPVRRATSATQRAPFAIDSSTSRSVTTEQWHTYIVDRLTGSWPDRASRTAGHWQQVSLA